MAAEQTDGYSCRRVAAEADNTAAAVAASDSIAAVEEGDTVVEDDEME